MPCSLHSIAAAHSERLTTTHWTENLSSLSLPENTKPSQLWGETRQNTSTNTQTAAPECLMLGYVSQLIWTVPLCIRCFCGVSTEWYLMSDTYLCWKLCSRREKRAGRTGHTKGPLGPLYPPPDWDGNGQRRPRELEIIGEEQKKKTITHIDFLQKIICAATHHPYHILFCGGLLTVGNISHYQTGQLVCALQCTVCGYRMVSILGLPALIHTAGPSQQSACLPPPRFHPILALHD